MPRAAAPSRTLQVLYAILALLFLISVTYRVLDVSERIAELRNGREYVREPFDIDLPEYRLVAVEEEAGRAGLAEGDRIVNINGRPIHYSGADLWVPLRAARAGDRLTVEAMRVVDGRPTTTTARRACWIMSIAGTTRRWSSAAYPAALRPFSGSTPVGL